MFFKVSASILRSRIAKIAEIAKIDNLKSCGTAGIAEIGRHRDEDLFAADLRR